MEYSDQTKRVFLNALSFWRPPPVLSLSEWADQHAYLSPESAHQSGRWKTLPYQKEIMDAFTDPRVGKITVMKSARVGYTKILNQVVGYHIHHAPKSILMVQPTVEDAQGYSKEELTPMLRDTPALRGVVAETKTRDSNNTILKKTYPGGFISLVGANSARGFRRISVPIVLFDEVDGYPPTAGSEGDQIKLGSKRAEWFWDKKIAIGSTPTIKDLSRVENSFKESDQRYYYVPCPFCSEFQPIEFKNIDWPKGEPGKAALKCIKCGELIPHSKKRAMVQRGEWRASKPFSGHAGFFIWAGYSFAPNATWAHIAADFLESKNDPERLKTFRNTTLGQTWEEKGDRPSWQRLASRAEPYKITKVPAGGMILTAFADVHDNRLDVVVRAWGRSEESWLIYWTRIYGDVSTDEPWLQLDSILSLEFMHESGVGLRIVSCGVDSGDNTQIVYNCCRKRGPVVFATYGSSRRGQPIIGKPAKKDVDYQGAVLKNGIQIWPIGADTAKNIIYQRLNQTEPGPGYYHFPLGIDNEYYRQLAAEKLVTIYDKKGFRRQEWHNVRGNRQNHALDCEVGCYAAAIRARIVTANWDLIEKRLYGTSRYKKNMGNGGPPENGTQKTKKSGFIPRNKGWLR